MNASDATLLIADFLKSHLLADVLGDGILVYKIVHRVGGDEVLCHVPDTLVGTGLSPGILYHIVLLSVLSLAIPKMSIPWSSVNSQLSKRS